MADVVSANTRTGSRPETKVSEQITLATKPVATLGKSRARAAERASATMAVEAARTSSNFLVGISSFLLGGPPKQHSAPLSARRIWNWPRRILAVPRRVQIRPGNTTRCRSGHDSLPAAIFGRRHPRHRLEGAIERAE